MCAPIGYIARDWGNVAAGCLMFSDIDFSTKKKKVCDVSVMGIWMIYPTPSCGFA
jgi:hypothetical protein